MTDTTRNVLPDGLAFPGPNVIGATGGSGTRVVARILRTSRVYTGEKLNPYEDAVELGFYSDRWIDRYVEAGGDVSPEQRAEMEADLRSVLADHLATRAARRGRVGLEGAAQHLPPALLERGDAGPPLPPLPP